MTTPATGTPAPAAATAGDARVLAGRYRLGRRIGAGGMATIVTAEDLHMERPVAVKVLHAHLADDAEVRTRFQAEARHAASLSHPHVVGVYDQGEADLPYIVMELIDGPSLRDVLATHGPLDPAQVLTVIEPLCDALDAAHRIGLIHRDIKPENVLVTAEGTAKLADFGIARVMAATSHTATGTLVGSVHYLAPELVDGAAATPASDQYALAVVAYELLTGRKPLPADTPMAIALRHANEDIPPPSRYAPEVSPALDAVIARATARDPAVRFPDLAAMGEAMRAAVDARPAAVTHLTDDGQVQTLVMPSEFAATTALSTGPQATAAEDLAARRVTPTDAPARPRRWPRRLGIALLTVVVVGLVGAAGVLAWMVLAVPPVAVADVVGMDQGEAFAQLDDDGLVMEIGAEEHRLDVPAGQVISQDPAAGAELEEGDAVTVVLSLGPRVVDMPDLLGQPYTDVVEVLEGNAFDVVRDEEHHDTAPEGHVIGQLPEAGSPVEQGSQVAVSVSLGIEQVTVPDLSGLTLAEAQGALEAVRLSAAVSEEWSDEVPEADTVVSQAVTAGATVDALTVVDVVISRGPLTLATPDLRGLPVDEARQQVEPIEEITLEEETGRLPTIGPFTFDTPYQIKEQVPAAGDPIQRGESIRVFYYVESSGDDDDD